MPRRTAPFSQYTHHDERKMVTLARERLNRFSRGVVLRAADPKSTDCRGQSHHNSLLSRKSRKAIFVTEEECGRQSGMTGNVKACTMSSDHSESRPEVLFRSFVSRPHSSSDLASLGHLPPGGRNWALPRQCFFHKNDTDNQNPLHQSSHRFSVTSMTVSTGSGSTGSGPRSANTISG